MTERKKTPVKLNEEYQRKLREEEEWHRRQTTGGGAET